MMTRCLSLVGGTLFCLMLVGQPAPAGEPAATLDWPPTSRETRPWAYWWWMGSAVNAKDLTANLERYRMAGMGGIHVIPIYGARGYEDQYLDYLSPQWLAMLRRAVREADRLDMGVDMTTGSGWCFGGPNIPDELANATVVFTRQPLEAGSPVELKERPAGAQAIVAVDAEGRSIDLTGRADAAGAIDRTAPGPGWELVVVSQRPSGRKVKRAAPGGAGHMLNPFCRRAIETYVARFDEAFADYDGPMPRAMYHDSFEYVSNWSPDLFQEFHQRRGYKLETEIGALLGKGPAEHVARVKCDYRETVSDMMVDNFIGTWVDWAHGKGCITRNQAHGSPGNLLDLYAAADVPETEMFNRDRDPLVSKFASSAAHVAGRRLVAAETGTWLDEHFTVTLAKLKGLVDELFVSGVNHVIYHGTCYSPIDAPWPGWCFYASTEMNPRNAFWRDVPTLNAYISRCQSVLQSGTPSSDVLVYWPIHDLWSHPDGMTETMTVHHRAWLTDQPVGKLARELWRRGYAFDFVSDRQLAETRFEAGRIHTPGADYRAILVPACHEMPLASLGHLVDLSEQGAAVIFEDHLPTDVPGMANLDERRKELSRLTARVKQRSSDDVAKTPLRRGEILVGEFDASLSAAGVDRESMVDLPGVAFVRRRHDAGYHYFIANQGDEPIDAWLPLARPAAAVAIMDAMTGEVGLAESKPDKQGVRVRVQIPAAGSVVLRTFDAGPIDGPRWKYVKPAGEPVAVPGRWQVEFIEGGPKLPAPFETDRLASWTELGGEEAQRFAGTARYTLRFDAPAEKADAWLIDLGRVAESARVRLNGRELGTRILPPYCVRVEGLKPKGNLLEVEVTNLSANRIRDLDRRKVAWRIFNDINFVNIDYKPFDASNWPVRESGLIGPVRLVPVAIE